MTPEMHEAMLKTVDLEKLAAKVPPEVVAAVQHHGLHKVAAQLLGLPGITESTAAMFVGRKLAARRAETQVVNTGLLALTSLGE